MFTQLSRSNNNADLRESTITGVVVKVLETKETETLILFSTGGEALPVREPSQRVIVEVIWIQTISGEVFFSFTDLLSENTYRCLGTLAS
jgi:hypothetical protein